MRDISYSRACYFLISLFIHTKDVVARFGAKKKEDRIVQFRQFMSEGQRFDRVGEQRENFYDTVVTRAKTVCWTLFHQFYLCLNHLF
jgi:hypothetical protein